MLQAVVTGKTQDPVWFSIMVEEKIFQLSRFQRVGVVC